MDYKYYLENFYQFFFSRIYGAGKTCLGVSFFTMASHEGILNFLATNLEVLNIPTYMLVFITAAISSFGGLICSWFISEITNFFRKFENNYSKKNDTSLLRVLNKLDYKTKELKVADFEKFKLMYKNLTSVQKKDLDR